MKSLVLAVFLVLVSVGMLPTLATAGEHGSAISCHLEYNLSGWSFVYKTADGTGTITCNNGASVAVSLSARGGGFTIGKSDIIGGRGKFSEVTSLKELYGNYVAAEAHAGATKSVSAQGMTKGSVSLSLRGTGQGFDLGIAFGNFRIEPK